jgi:hypothetical protein
MKDLFTQVKEMNIAFGNPEGDARELEPKGAHGVYNEVAWGKLQRQCENIGGKFTLNGTASNGKDISTGDINGEVRELLTALQNRDIEGVRDALGDIIVFALGAYHIAGYDGNADVTAILEGVMTRFCATPEILNATRTLWENKGVCDLYTEGQFPRVCVKARSDQYTDSGEFIPKGKFLKSVSYRDTVFAPAPVKGVAFELEHYSSPVQRQINGSSLAPLFKRRSTDNEVSGDE